MSMASSSSWTPTGAYVASAQLGDVQLAAGAQPAAQVVASIAIDAGDNVALFGTFAGEIDLFGQPQQAASEGPSGSLLGLFVAKLDSSQSVVFAETLGSQYANNPAGTIAVDPSGNMLVSTNAAADLSLPYAYPQLYRLDANTGAMLPGGFTQTTNNPLGYGLGVAVDACGNIQWADSEQVASLAPLQPMLRTVAE